MATENANSKYTLESIIRAVQWGDFNHVECSIEQHGFSVDSMDTDGCSLLHWAAINDRLDIAKYLVNKGANVHLTGGNNNENPLQWSVRSKTSISTMSLLLSEGASITHKSVYGCDALMIAVQSEQLNAALALLHAGADVNTTERNGDTPLYWLLRKYSSCPTIEFIELQRLLHRFNASVTHRSNDGCNALHIIAGSGPQVDFGSALMVYRAGNDEMLDTKNAINETPYKVALHRKNTGMVRFLFDAKLDRRLPFHSATAAAALAFVGSLCSLHLGGWMYGTLCIVPIGLAGEALSQPYVVTGASRLPCGLAWGVIISAILIFYTQLSEHFGFSIQVVGAFYSLSIPYTLLRSMTTPAQHIYCDSAAARQQLLQKLVEGERKGAPVRFCTTCLVDRAHVSMHCSKCNKCVVSLDHHCPFVCNCVGRGNRRLFVAFLACASTGCIMFTLLSLFVQYTHWCTAAGDKWSQLLAVQRCMLFHRPASLLLTYVTAFTGMWIAGIFCGQIGLIASETTTFELIKHGNQGRGVFSARGLRNVLLFFSTGNYPICKPSEGPNACEEMACSHAQHTRPPKGEFAADHLV